MSSSARLGSRGSWFRESRAASLSLPFGQHAGEEVPWKVSMPSRKRWKWSPPFARPDALAPVVVEHHVEGARRPRRRGSGAATPSRRPRRAFSAAPGRRRCREDELARRPRREDLAASPGPTSAGRPASSCRSCESSHRFALSLCGRAAAARRRLVEGRRRKPRERSRQRLSRVLGAEEVGVLVHPARGLGQRARHRVEPGREHLRAARDRALLADQPHLLLDPLELGVDDREVLAARCRGSPAASPGSPGSPGATAPGGCPAPRPSPARGAPRCPPRARSRFTRACV